MGEIRSFRDLDVYQMAVREARNIFQMTRSFPREEMYSLTDQIRRSSRAVAALIAEGWGRRRYRAAFVNKIDEALAETLETQAWLDHAVACEYLTSEQTTVLDAAWGRVGAMLHGVMNRADSFCKTTPRS